MATLGQPETMFQQGKRYPHHTSTISSSLHLTFAAFSHFLLTTLACVEHNSYADSHVSLLKSLCSHIHTHVSQTNRSCYHFQPV